VLNLGHLSLSGGMNSGEREGNEKIIKTHKEEHFYTKIDLFGDIFSAVFKKRGVL
jgi:hypothetical protein